MLLHLEIAEALKRGATIVTANQRAARTLRRAFDLHNKQLGLRSWQPAQVFAWDAWTATQWRRLLIGGHVSRLLLNQTQEHSVWLGILMADSELQSLRSKDALATLAADAWRRLCSYRGQSKLRGTASTPDSMAFERWAIAFHRKCRDDNFLAQSELEDALTSAVIHNDLHPEQTEIALLGFDRFTPAQAALLEAIRSVGCTVSELRPTVPTERRLLIQTASEEDEIATAARWAQQFLLEHPSAQITMIVPSLEEQRHKIDSVFRQTLAPDLEDIETSEDACPYEFSLGVPLTRTAMAQSALDLLHLATGRLSIERTSALLLSPYFAMQSTERAARAEFDAFEMRKAHRLRPEVSLDWLSTATYKSPRRQYLGQLPSALRNMQSIVPRLSKPQKRSHAEWAQVIRELLETAHWGRGRESSIEFQVRSKWESALDELATLDFDGSRADFGQAVRALEGISSQMTFAPESHNAPIQIMGAFEAAGITSDAIWLMHAGDLSWPVPISTNPLLPWRLQRELQMPGSDVAHDDIDACKLTERIAASAPTAFFSYAAQHDDEHQHPSPSLSGLDLTEVRPEEIAPSEPLPSAINLEPLNDDVSITPVPDAVVRGGAYILKSQAQCPFRAFAEHRLWSTQIEQPVPGIDAAESGVVIHHALELFWKEVRTQQQLQQMPSQEITALLDRCITSSLGKIGPVSETSWDDAYIQMQRARMNRLLMNWLELELERSPFEVEACEEKLNDARVGPLRLDVRLDRIDSVDGGKILIDYKTGNVAPKEWLSDRPDEPQLPLYATLTDTTKLQAVAFGIIRAGDDRGLIGFAASDDVLPKPARLGFASLEEQVEDWRRVIRNLATSFYHGDARVDPKAYPKTCEHCGQRILCRLDPSQLRSDDDATEVEIG